MRRDNQKYREVLELMSNLRVRTPAYEKKKKKEKKYYYLPFNENPRFWGREDILSQIQSSLEVEGKATLRSFALHGMGGVGKTQIALRYANNSRTQYDAIFWLAADNLVTIGQSYQEISKCLRLTKADMQTDDNAVMLGVKEWLAETSE